MIKSLRTLLGLCNHAYDVIEKHDVIVKRDGTFTSIDRAVRGEISHRLFIRQCVKCNKLSTLKVDIHTGVIKCQ